MSSRPSLRPQTAQPVVVAPVEEPKPSVAATAETKEAEEEVVDDGPQQEVEYMPLQNQWTLYFDSENKPPGTTVDDYQNSLKLVGEFSTVEKLWTYFNHLPKIGSIRPKANFHLFKSEIQPLWEDKKNYGCFSVLFPERDEELFNTCWLNAVLGLVGETLDDNSEINGAIAGRRNRSNKLQIWTKRLSKEASDTIKANIEKYILEGKSFEVKYEVFKQIWASFLSFFFLFCLRVYVCVF